MTANSELDQISKQTFHKSVTKQRRTLLTTDMKHHGHSGVTRILRQLKGSRKGSGEKDCYDGKGDSGKVWTICCCAPLHQKDFFWSICLLLHYNQPPIIGTMPIRDIGELPYPHLLCWRAMKVNRSHSVRTNSIFAINSSIVSQNYFNGSHLSPNNTRTCHQLICVDFVTKCRS